MTIKHIVISGAAYNGIDLVGAITELSEKKYIERKNIESVFGSSAGAIVLAIWLLDVEKSVLYDFDEILQQKFIDRPEIVFDRRYECHV